MKKRILSLCLSAAIALSMTGFAVYASEAATEGSTTTETAAVEEEQTQEEVEAEVVTDAAGNVITPETAQAIDNADLGVTDIIQRRQQWPTELRQPCRRRKLMNPR